MSEINPLLVQLQQAWAEGHYVKGEGVANEVVQAFHQAAIEKYGVEAIEVVNSDALAEQWSVGGTPPVRQVEPAYPGPNSACMMGAHAYNPQADSLGRHVCMQCGLVNVTGD
jgi:hypothetical protein